MSGRGKGKTAKKSVTQSSKAGLQFPVGRVAVSCPPLCLNLSADLSRVHCTRASLNSDG